MALQLFKLTGMLLFRTLVVCFFLSVWSDEFKRFSKGLGTELSDSFQIFFESLNSVVYKELGIPGSHS